MCLWFEVKIVYGDKHGKEKKRSKEKLKSKDEEKNLNTTIYPSTSRCSFVFRCRTML